MSKWPHQCNVDSFYRNPKGSHGDANPKFGEKMKHIILICSLAILTACATQSQQKDSVSLAANAPVAGIKEISSSSLSLSEPALYLLPDKALQVTQIGAVLDSLKGNENIILYVHGRAGGKKQEPSKSLKDVMPSLTEDYKAKAIMFYWPGAGDGGVTGFPEERARQAAPALTETLKALQNYKQANATRLQNVKFILLLHSMGSIVFEQFINLYAPRSLDRNLFDTVILNSSSSATKGHDVWLKKVDFTRNLYVTVNNDDSVLRSAGLFRGVRLGKDLKHVNLAQNAVYSVFYIYLLLYYLRPCRQRVADLLRNKGCRAATLCRQRL